MAGANLLALIDDIATMLDDVSVLTKVAAKKTAGVLGDDLALNAQQVSGVSPARELPVVWAVAKGSLLNKVILVPAAMVISVFMPWLVIPLLMLGGAYLCFEGFEKVAHKWLHPTREPDPTARAQARAETLQQPKENLLQIEKSKIKGAIRTDFILSAEIIAITLGTVTAQTVGMQFTVLCVVALLVTVGVYGLVAGIVKLDDGGLYLSQRDGRDGLTKALRRLGRGILVAAPYLMKGLSVVGTAAMFLVGGGIISHGIGPLSAWLKTFTHDLEGVAGVLVTVLADGLIGVLVGALVVAVVTLVGKGWGAVKGSV
ncbi:DUF808 domain-containing protein [Marinobacter sp. X15-166B]|uniref:DUF808 domain-containing protein n=1 Tax=Marinobacter sp. X15-166B TaxID=1897620 RepID=UPI00085BEEEF|nr:DUF808 domain-containing protein [Marinobacter sp. X15-166B]OEY65667.1 hypothetical protein BG841_03815 [Marinobacter sp. X15-166B]